MNMLQPEYPQSVRSFESPRETTTAAPETLQSVIEFVRRQYQVIGLAAMIAIALGIIYLLTAPPSYTATATMIIDTKNARLFQQQSTFSDLPIDTGTVDSQVEIIKSETVALAVIKQLHLTEDPEFVNPGGGIVGTLVGAFTGLFSAGGPSSEFALTRTAVGALQNRLTVRRVGLTYVIVISFRSLNPDRAAEIANAVADAYIDDQLESKYQAARRAGTWLQARLSELRQQASTAERAVAAFKNKNDIVDAGGRSINEQQLAEFNSELVLARSRTADARAKFERVQSVLNSNSPEATVAATVADSLKNDVITKLRSQYLELSAREGDWSTRYGANHLAVVNLRNQMREIQNSVRNELQRIAETYKSDYEIARQREEGVQKQLEQAVSQSQVTNEAQVALRELESSSQTYRALYDNFLQRYMESVQQQSFPITDARVISAATRPLFKSHPRSALVLTVALAVGLAFGVAAGAWRDLADRVFRTARQVESLLQTDCVALVPAVKEATQKDKILYPDREPQAAKGLKLPDSVPQAITFAPGVFSTIIDSPFSAFTEAIRSIKVAIDLSPSATDGKIIGFTSSVPNEGKSSMAVAVARLAAHTGARTLLIDCDLKNPSLSRELAPKAPCGLLEVLRGQAPLERAIWLDTVTNMRFLPAATKARLAHSSEVLASAATRKLFDSLRHDYDYIIVDFSPLMPIVDVRASTNLVDSYLYVVSWGRTRIEYVEQALRSAKGVYEHLLGVVLNNVDLEALGRYSGPGRGYHYDKSYARYGYTE